MRNVPDQHWRRGQGGEGEQGARGERDAELGRGAHQLVAHDRAADDGVRPADRDLRVGDVNLGDAVGAGRDVPEIAGVAVVIGRGAVVLARGVEVGAGAHAAVGRVTQLVHVEAVLPRRLSPSSARR